MNTDENNNLGYIDRILAISPLLIGGFIVLKYYFSKGNRSEMYTGGYGAYY